MIPRVLPRTPLHLFRFFSSHDNRRTISDLLVHALNLTLVNPKRSASDHVQDLRAIGQAVTQLHRRVVPRSGGCGRPLGANHGVPSSGERRD